MPIAFVALPTAAFSDNPEDDKNDHGTDGGGDNRADDPGANADAKLRRQPGADERGTLRGATRQSRHQYSEEQLHAGLAAAAGVSARPARSVPNAICPKSVLRSITDKGYSSGVRAGFLPKGTVVDRVSMF